MQMHSHRLTGHSFDQDAELGDLIEPIVRLMKAEGALLSLHTPDAEQPTLLHADCLPADVLAEALRLAARAAEAVVPGEARQSWHRLATRPEAALLIVPLKRVVGHERLMLTLLVAGATDRSARMEARLENGAAQATGIFRLWQQKRVLERRAQALEAALEQTSVGTLLLDRTARVVFANQTAREIVAAGDGLSLNGRVLRATRLMDGVNLQAALAHATADRVARGTAELKRVPLLAFHRGAAAPLVAAVLPGGDRDCAEGEALAVMYVVDPVLDVSSTIAPLCHLHGLSPVETSLVCRLVGGATLAVAAAALRVKEQTARSYLKAIFIKTGTRRQTELLALMLSSLLRIKRGIGQEALAS